MAAEQVLRAGALKQHTGASYERLAFGVADSTTYRSFCRLGFDKKPPTKSTLQKNLKRVKPGTWEAISQLPIKNAQHLGVEKGEKVRIDCMVIESNIHRPNDSSLLGDCVRVRATGSETSAAYDISNAKSMKERTPLYRDLLKITRETVKDAEQIAAQLDRVECETVKAAIAAQAIAAEIRHFLPLVNQVISQTERRVFGGESVPVAEKVVSIFEPAHSIITKANRVTEYGHKVCLTAGASAIVTDVIVETGNPADATLAVKMIERQKELFGKLRSRRALTVALRRAPISQRSKHCE
jgi:transposase, IS5 family